MDISEYFPIWSKLTEAQQERLSNAAVKRSAVKGTLLHNGSEDCLGLIIVASGQLRASICSDEGREITIYRLFERDICLFSASCMFQSLQFDIVVEAEKDSVFYIIPTDVYKKIMDESAAIANYTNQIMAERFADVMWLLEQIMWKSMDKRLASFLIQESSLENTDILRITHEKIGSHLGTAREVVTRMLKYFQSEGMVALKRGAVEITDKKKLEELAER